MHYVYGLRRPGDSELRYVGMTRVGIENRLRQHRSEITYRENQKLGIGGVHAWMREGEVEAVALSEHATRAEALAGERAAVEFCLKLGHRLFNLWLVPAELRRAA